MADIPEFDRFFNGEFPFNYKYLRPLFDESLLDKDEARNVEKNISEEKVNPYNTSSFSIESHHKPLSKIVDYDLLLKTSNNLSFD